MRPTKAESRSKAENKRTLPWPQRGQETIKTGVDFTPIEIKDPGSCVYFVGSPDGTSVKVGFTRNPQHDLKRVTQHKGVWAENETVLLAAVRGTTDNEQSVLRYFDDKKIKGQRETIRTEAILPYIIWLRDQHYVSTTLEEWNTQRGQMAIDPTCWLPSDNRKSSRQAEASLFQMEYPWLILPDREVMGDDWYTPQSIIDPIREALGGTIDLDPATHVYAQEVIRAKEIYTRGQSGLLHPWKGNVYLNPPFSEWNLWLTKAVQEISSGRITAIILLGFSRTLTAHYFASLLNVVHAICIRKGRISFWGHESKSKSSPDGPIFLYWGPDVHRFSRAMKDVGVVLIRDATPTDSNSLDALSEELTTRSDIDTEESEDNTEVPV